MKVLLQKSHLWQDLLCVFRCCLRWNGRVNYFCMPFALHISQVNSLAPLHLSLCLFKLSFLLAFFPHPLHCNLSTSGFCLQFFSCRYFDCLLVKISEHHLQSFEYLFISITIFFLQCYINYQITYEIIESRIGFNKSIPCFNTIIYQRKLSINHLPTEIINQSFINGNYQWLICMQWFV